MIPHFLARLGFVRYVLAGALLLAESGCTSLGYVTQAAAGQADLNQRARDIDMLVREERVDARKRRLLSEVAVMKRFGERTAWPRPRITGATCGSIARTSSGS